MFLSLLCHVIVVKLSICFVSSLGSPLENDMIHLKGFILMNMLSSVKAGPKFILKYHSNLNFTHRVYSNVYNWWQLWNSSLNIISKAQSLFDPHWAHTCAVVSGHLQCRSDYRKLGYVTWSLLLSFEESFLQLFLEMLLVPVQWGQKWNCGWKACIPCRKSWHCF